jgi:hypothetical protein
VSKQHRRPLLAFVVVLVACGVIIVTGLRSEAVRHLVGLTPRSVVAGSLVPSAPAPRPTPAPTATPGGAPTTVRSATTGASVPDRSGRRPEVHRPGQLGGGFAPGPASAGDSASMPEPAGPLTTDPTASPASIASPAPTPAAPTTSPAFPATAPSSPASAASGGASDKGNRGDRGNRVNKGGKDYASTAPGVDEHVDDEPDEESPEFEESGETDDDSADHEGRDRGHDGPVGHYDDDDRDHRGRGHAEGYGGLSSRT